MRLQALEIPVVDMDRAFAFYTQVLGFPVVNRRGKDSAILFLGNVHDGMVTLRRQDEAPGQGVRFLMESEEPPDEVRARLEGAGVALDGPNRNLGIGIGVYFSDTEGNRLGIVRTHGVPRLRDLKAMSFPELMTELDGVEERARSLLEGLTETEARNAPAPGEWTIVDQVGHIRGTLESCPAIITALSRGRPAPRGGLLEVTYPSPSLEVAAEKLWPAFASSRAALSALPAEPDLLPTLGHGVFGPLNCHGWTALMVFHIGMHLDQISAIKSAHAS